MTTTQAEQQYLAEHNARNKNKDYAIYNPNNKPVNELPIIYGFNNGGQSGWFTAQLLAEDGTALGSHVCSHEDYMLHDLGILEGTRLDRHETFKKHYPNGYQMDFVTRSEVNVNEGLTKAYKLNQAMRPSNEA